ERSSRTQLEYRAGRIARAWTGVTEEVMLAPGTVLEDRYEVQELIGQGATGAVYRALDRHRGTSIAIKETFFPAGEGRGAFAREARLLMALDHPAIPRVVDYFSAQGAAYLVMELVAGPNLRERLNEQHGPCTLADVLNWSDQLLEAIAYLHAQAPPT